MKRNPTINEEAAPDRQMEREWIEALTAAGAATAIRCRVDRIERSQKIIAEKLKLT